MLSHFQCAVDHQKHPLVLQKPFEFGIIPVCEWSCRKRGGCIDCHSSTGQLPASVTLNERVASPKLFTSRDWSLIISPDASVFY